MDHQIMIKEIRRLMGDGVEHTLTAEGQVVSRASCFAASLSGYGGLCTRACDPII